LAISTIGCFDDFLVAVKTREAMIAGHLHLVRPGVPNVCKLFLDAVHEDVMATRRAPLSALRVCTAAPALRHRSRSCPREEYRPAAWALRAMSNTPTDAAAAAVAEVFRKSRRVTGIGLSFHANRDGRAVSAPACANQLDPLVENLPERSQGPLRRQAVTEACWLPC
jgi:hypothetical protein